MALASHIHTFYQTAYYLLHIVMPRQKKMYKLTVSSLQAPKNMPQKIVAQNDSSASQKFTARKQKKQIESRITKRDKGNNLLCIV